MNEEDRLAFYKSIVEAYEGIVETQQRIISQLLEERKELK